MDSIDNPELIQLKNPMTKRWVVIDLKAGIIVKSRKKKYTWITIFKNTHIWEV